MAVDSSWITGLEIRYVRNIEDAFELRRWLGQRRPVLGYDIESTGLHIKKDKVRLVQVGDCTGGWAIDFEGWRSFAQTFLADYTGPIVGHNLKFDINHSANVGIGLPGVDYHDTMTKAHLIDSTRRVGLKELSDRLIDPRASIGQKALKDIMHRGRWDWATIPVDCPEYWGYGVLDTCITAKLDEELDPFISSLGLRELYDLEMAVSMILGRMERRGVEIDVQYCEDKYTQLSEYVAEMKAYVEATWGVNPASPSALARKLMEEGMRWDKRTATGKAAADAEVLKELAQAYPDSALAKCALEYREAQKVQNTYFKALLNEHHHGVIHCSFRQLGAETGRMSCANPNLQQIPKGKVVRDAFVARDGMRLVSADYDGMELAGAANWGDNHELAHTLLEANSGRSLDFHSLTAQKIFHLEGQPTKKQRGAAKATTFLVGYGGGAGKLARSTGLPDEEAVKIMADYHNAYPGIRAYQRRLEIEARQNQKTFGRPVVRSLMGRIHYLEDDFMYKATNYAVQGGCATLIKVKLVAAADQGLEDYLRLVVHDEVIAEFPEALAAEMTHTLVEAMEERDPALLVPFTVEATRPLLRWGDKEE